MTPVLAFTIDDLLDKIGPLIFFLFFFALPLLKAIREKVQEARQARERGVPPGGSSADATGPDELDEDAGRKAWDDLLRGDAPAPTATTSVPASPPPIVRTAAPRERSLEAAVGDAPQPSALSGPLNQMAPVPTEDEEESALDEERMARERNERLLREEFERRSAFLRQEREHAARTSVAPSGLTSLGATSLTATAPEAEPAAARTLSASERVFGRRLDRATLRRALVASEILGRPAALRGPGDGAGPIALRS